MISHEKWNALIKPLAEWLPAGFIANVRSSWQHPWEVTPTLVDGVWKFSINPGFVFNGRTCDVTMEGVPLTESGPIGLLTALHSPETIPPFFQQLGVTPPITLTEDAQFQVSGLLSAEQRQLRSFDFVLNHDRIGTRTDWTLGSGTDGMFAQFSVGFYTMPNAKKTAYITQVPSFQASTDLLSALLGGGADTEPIDKLLLATIWFLSPPNTSPAAEVDETWTPYPQPHIYWNLRYSATLTRVELANQNITVNIPSAGGLLQTIGNAMLANQNDSANAAVELLRANLAKGMFWTL